MVGWAEQEWWMREGDKVKCVRANDSEFTLGGVYEIESTIPSKDDSTLTERVMVRGASRYYRANRFEPYVEPVDGLIDTILGALRRVMR